MATLSKLSEFSKIFSWIFIWKWWSFCFYLLSQFCVNLETRQRKIRHRFSKKGTYFWIIRKKKNPWNYKCTQDIFSSSFICQLYERFLESWRTSLHFLADWLENSAQLKQQISVWKNQIFEKFRKVDDWTNFSKELISKPIFVPNSNPPWPRDQRRKWDMK